MGEKDVAFVQKREKGDYTPSAEKLDHIQETLQLLSAMTRDHRFEEVYNESIAEGGVQNMCDVLERVERRGELRGEEKKAKEIAIKMYKRGMQPADIADILNEALGKVQQWLGLVTA